MINVSPEELRRLQILNDYVAQSIEAAQRINPYLQQRGPWHTGYIPGATPWGSIPAMGGIGGFPYGIHVPRTPFVSPYANGAAFGAPMPAFPVPGTGFPMTTMAPFGVNTWGVPTGLFHSAANAPGFLTGSPWSDAHALGAMSAGNALAAAAAMNSAYGANGAGAFAPYATGLQHSAASFAPYAGAAAALNAAYSSNAAAALGQYANGLSHSAASFAPNASYTSSAAPMGAWSMAADPWSTSAAAFGGMHAATDAAARAEAYRRALISAQTGAFAF